MNAGTDVIVVGGGVIGGMLTYWLARSGRTVRLLERGLPGQEASGAFAGLLTTSAEGSDEGPYLSLSRQALTTMRETVARLEAETGLDIGLVCSPLYRVATGEQERATLYAHWQRLQQRGERATWLEPGNLPGEAPALSSRITGAICSPEEYHLVPALLLDAALKSAQHLGATVQCHTEVHALLTQGDRIIGVEAEGTRYFAEHIILANGAWSPSLLRPLKLQLAVSPQKGQMLGLVCRDYSLSSIINTAWGYIVPKPDNTIVVGATREDSGFAKHITVAGMAHLLRAIAVLPPLMQSTIAYTFVGLRPLSRDGMPLLGPIPGWQGLHAATGHSQHGILLAAITAQMLTQYINGEDPGELWPAFQVARALSPVEDKGAER